MHSSHATRAHRSMMQSIADIDGEPMPAIVLSDELRAQAMIDYLQDCRAAPNDDWPSFDEYLADWLECYLHDQSIAEAEEEIADELAAMREVEAMRQREAWPLCDDSEIPF